MALEHEVLEESGDSRKTEERFVLNTDWRGYSKILDAIGEGHVRVTYDSGRLELLSPSPEHEMTKSLLSRLVEILLDEGGTGYLLGGSITFRRKGLDKGLEPDECFWLASRQAMIGVKRWNPRIHPPPDLAVEIEVTQSAVSRLPIFAALGVPEVWRCRHGVVRPFGLGADRAYVPLSQSRVVLGADFDMLSAHVRMADRRDTFEIKQSFRAHLRGQASSGAD